MSAVLHGRYLLSDTLGEGAYGVVCRAVDLKSAKRSHVAVKTIDLELLPPARRAYAIEAIDREVKLLRSIEHANVLRAVDFISDSTRLHIILELLEGPDLQAVLDSRGALRTTEVKSILLQCTQALDHLHDRAIVHRDVKPANVMLVHPLAVQSPSARAKRAEQRAALHSTDLSGRHLKLVDFGLARVVPHAIYPRRKALPASPGGSRHGGGLFNRSPNNSRHGGSILGTLLGHSPNNSRHAGGVFGRSPNNSRHGGGLFGHSPNNSRHGGGLFARGGGNSKFELSAHGSQIYAPPEFVAAWQAALDSLLVSASEASKVDVYALGKMLEYLLTGTAPDGTDGLGQPATGCCGCLGGAREAPPERHVVEVGSLDAEVRELLESMTATAADTRLSLAEVLEHPWLSDALPADVHAAAADTPATATPATRGGSGGGASGDDPSSALRPRVLEFTTTETRAETDDDHGRSGTRVV